MEISNHQPMWGRQDIRTSFFTYKVGQFCEEYSTILLFNHCIKPNMTLFLFVNCTYPKTISLSLLQSQFSNMSVFFFMLLVAILNPVVSHKSCDFPAVINLGDSNSDTGGFASAFIPPTSPYGDTYFHMPARRFSDGRLIIDFIGITYLHSPSLLPHVIK